MTAVDDKIVAEALGTRAVFHTKPPKVELEMPLDGAPGWRLGLLILVHEGSLVIGEVKIFPEGDRRDPVVVRRGEFASRPRQWSEDAAALVGIDVPTITTRMLRSIRLGEIIPTIRTALEKTQSTPLERGVWDEVLGPQPSTLGEAFADVLSHSTSRSRRGDLYLARLAQRYIEFLAAGSKRPNRDLAEEIRSEPSHIRDSIFRARERGYLTSSFGPRAGGTLTQAGRDVLLRATEATKKSPTRAPKRGATAPSPFTQATKGSKR